MRLVIDVFDHSAASASRVRGGAFISNSAVSGHDPASLDTYTGLPFELEQEILLRFHSLSEPLRLPQSIWDDLALPERFPAVRTGCPSQGRHKLDANAQVFTPGLGFTPSHAKSRRQQVSETIQPVFAPLRSLDWRFGLIQVDYLEGPIHHMAPSMPLSPAARTRGLELPAIFESRERSKSESLQPSDRQAERSNRPIPGSSGSLDLGYGVLHLYKDKKEHTDGAQLDLLEKSGHEAAGDDGHGTMVAILAVPSNWATADFLQFISPAVDQIEQMRIMRDALPNRYMVLIKFHTKEQASAFESNFNGRPYSEMLLDEVCHVVRITAVEVRTSANAPYTFAFPQEGAPFAPEQDVSVRKEKGINELPTCPVCLERMDSNVSGLITVQCSHTFHCLCLKGWASNNCPVCRYSQGKNKNDRLRDESLPTSCATCGATESLWMCLICGHAGCGRFSGRHAYAHFEETGHSFAFELESHRVWDYARDEYVHRLIQSKADGKLVELPSGNAPSGKGKEGPHGSAGDEIAKIEAISMEFSDLLTTQLDSQRYYYAEKVTRLKAELADTELRHDKATREANRLKKELQAVQTQGRPDRTLQEAEEAAIKLKLDRLERETMPQLERERSRMEHKLGKATELARGLHRDLENEKSVSRGLMENISKLREENERRKKESEGMEAQIKDLSEQLQDLMFALTAQAQIVQQGGTGGDVVVHQAPPSKSASSRRKRK